MEISVVIPVFNRGYIVSRTLNAVKQQTYRPIHLILVDNNSTDNSLAVLQSFKNEHETADFKISITSEVKQSASAARNKGATLASSEWLTFFDSDDTMEPDLIERYVSKIKENPNCDIVLNRADWTDGNRTVELYFKTRNHLNNHLIYSHFSTIRYIIRRSLFYEIGKWNESLTRWDDFEIGTRILLQEPKVVTISNKVLVHAIHQSTSLTGSYFSPNFIDWEAALDACETAIAKSTIINKSQLLKIINFRRIHLSAMYHLEGEKELSIRLYNHVMNNPSLDFTLRWLLPLLYLILKQGGRGAVPLLKLFIR